MVIMSMYYRWKDDLCTIGIRIVQFDYIPSFKLHVVDGAVDWDDDVHLPLWIVDVHDADVSFHL